MIAFASIVLQFVQLRHKLIDLIFKLFKSFEKGALLVLRRCQPLTGTPMFEQCRPVKPKFLDVKSAGRRQAAQRGVSFLRDVTTHVITQRMKNAARAAGTPVIAFEFIAGVAGINQVIQRRRTAVNARLKMIGRQQRAGIRFTHAAVAAGVAEKFAQLES